MAREKSAALTALTNEKGSVARSDTWGGNNFTFTPEGRLIISIVIFKVFSEYRKTDQYKRVWLFSNLSPLIDLKPIFWSITWCTSDTSKSSVSTLLRVSKIDFGPWTKHYLE